MNDNALLKLAAKAAGNYVVDGLDYADQQDFWCIDEAGDRVGWNPLTDDGDALRLAVKLQLNISFIGGSVCAEWHSRDPAPSGWAKLSDGDANTATRRAIVLAAAEIGKTL